MMDATSPKALSAVSRYTGTLARLTGFAASRIDSAVIRARGKGASTHMSVPILVAVGAKAVEIVLVTKASAQ